MPRKFKFAKFGLIEDPRGAHVTLPYRGRQLLGEVKAVEFNQVCGKRTRSLNVPFGRTLWVCVRHSYLTAHLGKELQ